MPPLLVTEKLQSPLKNGDLSFGDWNFLITIRHIHTIKWQLKNFDCWKGAILCYHFSSSFFFSPFLCFYCHFMPFPPCLLGWSKKFGHHQTMGCIGWQPKRFDCHSTYFHHQMVTKEFHSPSNTHTIISQPKFAQERKWGMKLFFNKMIA